MSDEALSAFSDALQKAGYRVSEFLAADCERSAADIEAAVEALPKPDPDEFERLPSDE